MIDRNNDKYIKFVNYMNMSKIFCCSCICLVKITSPTPDIGISNSNPQISTNDEVPANLNDFE